MENIYILIYCINSDDIPEYNKIYKAIQDNLELYSSRTNDVKETSTIYYQMTATKNIEFMGIMELYLRRKDSFTIINLTSQDCNVYIWNGEFFKELHKYQNLLLYHQ